MAPARHTADSVLAAAAATFTERGYDGTSMDDLARATGLAKSSLYHHVSGKEELLRRAVDRALDALEAVLEEPAATSGPALDRLEHVVRRTVDVLFAELPYVRVLLHAGPSTAAGRYAIARRRRVDERLAALVERAVAEGELRGDVPSLLAARLLFGMVNSIAEWRDPSRQARGPVADAVVALALDGLRRR